MSDVTHENLPSRTRALCRFISPLPGLLHPPSPPPATRVLS